MSTLKVGAALSNVPALVGRWSVWSQAGDGPGAFFLVPADEDAREHGVKYAVIRATRMASEVRGPVIELIRTDPVRPDLLEAAQRIANERKQQRSTSR